MPEEFDPAWEYFEPPPEIAAIFAESGEIDDESLVFGSAVWDESGNRNVPIGFRFGFGNPNRFAGRLASERVPTVRDAPKKLRLLCSTCDAPFTARCRTQMYCSVECVPHLGAPRRLPDVQCLTCGDVFRPSSSRTRYCSVECVPHLGAALRRLPDVECRTCNVTFRPLAARTRYCSLKCGRANNGAPRVLADRVCPGCGKTFRPDRADRKFCSNACYVRPGRPRTLPDFVACAFCAVAFRPDRKGRTCCSAACGSRLAARLKFAERQCPQCGGIPARRPGGVCSACGETSFS